MQRWPVAGVVAGAGRVEVGVGAFTAAEVIGAAEVMGAAADTTAMRVTTTDMSAASFFWGRVGVGAGATGPMTTGLTVTGPMVPGPTATGLPCHQPTFTGKSGRTWLG